MNDIAAQFKVGDRVDVTGGEPPWRAEGTILHCDGTGGLLVQYVSLRTLESRTDWFSASTLVRDMDLPADRSAVRIQWKET